MFDKSYRFSTWVLELKLVSVVNEILGFKAKRYVFTNKAVSPGFSASVLDIFSQSRKNFLSITLSWSEGFAFTDIVIFGYWFGL